LWALLLISGGPLHAATTSPLLAKNENIRVMALGDSITAGVAAGGVRLENGGYRGALAAMLAQRGYHVTFVGGRDDYGKAISAQHHEGWPGFVLRSWPSDPGPGQLYGPLLRHAMQTDAPDVVLLMAGTNDLLRLQRGKSGYTVPNIINAMDLVLDEIVRARPTVHVIVAPVVASPRVDWCTLARFNGDDACGRVLTASLRTLVGDYASRGFNVTLAADMWRAVPRDAAHFPDGIHPTSAGYSSIANVWLDAIVRITAPGSPNEQPVARN
jgi:lysophospholipase L1-like esterase